MVSSGTATSTEASGENAWHRFAALHLSPMTLQMPPAQQGWPAPPQGLQTSAEQIRVVVLQVSPVQHTSPAPPQATHFPPTQNRLEPVHTSPVQHSSPAPPQVPQLPPAHTPPMPGQVER